MGVEVPFAYCCYSGVLIKNDIYLTLALCFTVAQYYRVYCSKELVERSDDTNRKRRLRNLNFDFPKFNTENSGFPDPEIINLFLRPNVHSITKESLERLCKAPFHENQTKVRVEIEIFTIV